MYPHTATPASHPPTASDRWPEISDADEAETESDETLLLGAALPILGTLGLLAVMLLATLVTALV